MVQTVVASLCTVQRREEASGLSRTEGVSSSLDSYGETYNNVGRDLASICFALRFRKSHVFVILSNPFLYVESTNFLTGSC